MKLLIVFLSALVLVAQGKAAPSSDEERVNQVQAEPVAEYVADEEAAAAQAEFFEAAPAENIPVVYGAGPQRAMGFQDIADGFQSYVPQTLYIPIISRACTNSACVEICNLLGFTKGICVSATTCQCYN
ncbi:hypothetical protein PYW07_015799 [Mythimna separata]|uniref:Uncharacterized protein n=1 Tax=Mythimna separata TaxID=271217 RepID=A0AAD8DVR7_MYTSE|nr:hypothetical protein PYW07_015799 [Mythimna separata]